MTFIVHIDEVLDGRPNGTVRYEDDQDELGFDGWVALLRILETHADPGRRGAAEVTDHDRDHGGDR